MIRILVLVAAALAFALPAFAQQYKWVDKDGKVRYGDTPPPGVKATPLQGPASGPAPAPAAPASSAKGGKDAKGAKGKEPPLTPEQAFQKRRQEEQSASEKEMQSKAQNEEAKANCDNARSTLAQLESGARIARTNPSGERYYIDDNQRLAETERAQKSVSTWCK